MCKKITFLLILSLLIISCSEDNSSGPSNENGSGSQGSEIPCNTSNEGMVIKPADSETERICKDGVWEVVLNSSSSVQVVESSSSEIINIPVPVNSSANEIFSSSAEESSSSILSSGETTESSSSETEIIEQSSSSSEEFIESSSSEETKLYLCEDGETYVLDPANCEKVSSSSVAVASSSSDNKQISSSSDIQESSSAGSSSSDSKFSSSAEGSSSDSKSSSSAEGSSSDSKSSSSAGSSSSDSKSSSSAGSSSSDSKSSSSAEGSSSDSKSSSSVVSSSSLNSAYDSVHNTLTDLRDGQVYKTATIGSQVWMAENLNYLPQDTIDTFWAGRSICGGGDYKSLQEGDCSIYGRLYETSFTENANYRKEICPDGWSIPSKNQYQTLIAFLGDNVGNKLKDKEGNLWSKGDNTNESGLSVIPSGYWSPYYGFNYLEKEGDAVATLAMIPSSIQNALRIDENNYEFAGYGQWLFIAFRCIKD